MSAEIDQRRSGCVMGCVLRNQHLPGCLVERCGGCLPRPPRVGDTCLRCYGDGLDALRAMPDLAVQVASRRDGRLNLRVSPTAGGIHAVGYTPASMSPAWDSAEEVIAWAHAWADILATHMRGADPSRYAPTGIPVRVLSRSVGFLVAHYDRVVAAPFARDLLTEAGDLTTRLQRQSGRGELTHRLKGSRCPTCQQQTLVRHDGASKVECCNPDCRRVWTEGEYAHLARTATS